MTDTRLRFVQIEANETVLIDSRIYCSEVINVNHSDWMRDTLQKYQTLIEQHFGLLRFENGAVKTEDSRGTKYVKYCLLTEAQTNFALTLSRNSAEVVQKKAELVADFERAKQLLKLYLELKYTQEKTDLLDENAKLTEINQSHLLNLKQTADALIRSEEQLADAQQKIIELKAQLTENGITEKSTEFEFDLDFLWDITGIATRDYLIRVVIENFSIGSDYSCTPDQRPHKGNLPKTKYWVTKECHDLLVIALRSVKGVDTKHLPETLIINRDSFFRDKQSKKGNSRFGKKRK